MLLFSEGITTIGVILRNSAGFIMEAWVNPFVTDNPFCSEAEAALNAAAAYPNEVMTLEGDALNVVMALNGLRRFCGLERQSKDYAGPTPPSLSLLLATQFFPREGNRSTHNLAHWAIPFDFCGFVR